MAAVSVASSTVLVHRSADGRTCSFPVLSCKRFRDNEVRLRLPAVACAGLQPGRFASRCIELPEAMADWSLTSLQLKLIKLGAHVVRHDPPPGAQRPWTERLESPPEAGKTPEPRDRPRHRLERLTSRLWCGLGCSDETPGDRYADEAALCCSCLNVCK